MSIALGRQSRCLQRAPWCQSCGGKSVRESWCRACTRARVFLVGAGIHLQGGAALSCTFFGISPALWGLPFPVFLERALCTAQEIG